MAINSLNLNQNYSNVIDSQYSKKTEHNRSYYNVTPETALSWDFKTSMNALKGLIGSGELNAILKGQQVESPHAGENNSEWLKQ